MDCFVASAPRNDVETVAQNPLASSWPGLSRPSTSSPPQSKTWMPGTSPGMTRSQDDAASFCAGAFAVITNPSYPFTATSLQIWR
jgi:hypothetical protein